MDFVVLSSGIVEIALGLAMIFWGKQKQVVGMVLALFFILIFPGNISQYTNGIDAFGLDTDTKRFVRLFFQPVLILWALWSTGALQSWLKNRREEKEWKNKSFYDFEAVDIRGNVVKMSDFKGKKVVVVNTASKCGLTPQYKDLQALYEKYGSDKFVIVGFPANDFMSQEPGTNDEIGAFCQKNYGVTFPMMSKISVKGEDQHPIYQFLTQKSKNGLEDNEVEWNFQKYLINENGELEKVISPRTSPMDDAITSWILAI
jgi:glutathione peroxidase-family protein